MTMRGRLLVAAGAVLVLSGTAVSAPDVVVLGCNEGNAGEVGVRELLGAVGDTVGVPVTVHTVAPLDAFGLDLTFPTHLLGYVRTDPGNLTAGWWTVTGSYRAAESAVRIGGLDPGGIPAGITGQLAVVHFEVTAAGADSFFTGSYVDDLKGYAACDSLNSPTKIPIETWANVKALYR
jgi:hypothetical protein